MHLLKYTIWQSESGLYHCNDITDLAGISGKWWVPARMLGISLTDYILLLKDTYNAIIGGYFKETDYLSVSWNNYTDISKFVNFINSKSKKINFLV